MITYKLAGKVTHLGLPVAGVTVSLKKCGEENGHAITLTTSGRGEYQFAIEPANYRLLVTPSESTSFVGQEYAEVAVFSNTVFNVTLTTGFVLKGKVVTKSGVPFGPCMLIIEEAGNGKNSICQATNEKGRFTSVLARGQYNIFLRPAGKNIFVTNSFNSIDLTSDLDTTLVVPDMVEFSGHIVDSNDKPQPQTKVIVSPTQKHRYLPQSDKTFTTTCVADGNGDFKIHIEPASYDFTFQPAEFSPLTEHKEEAVVVSRDLRRTYMLAHGFRLIGNVSYEGKALDNCLVEICPEANGKPSFIACKEGVFSCGLTNGTYTLKVLPDEESDRPFAPWIREVTVTSDIDLDIKLAPGTRITGCLADKEGKPLSLVPVNIYGEGGITLRDTTDSEGKYSFAVAPGKYQLGLNDDRALTETIEIENTPFTHNICWDSACIVRFKVVGEQDDQPVSSCKVSWEPYSPHETQGQAKLLEINHGVRLGSTYTDEEGICQMTLPNGIYTFHFHPSEQSTVDDREIRQLSIAGEFKRKVKLPPKS
jgi:hypothetical protein